MDIAALEMDVVCYATAAYHEGSNKYERIAIINVIRNRLHTRRWGDTVCSVVYADNQFVGVWDDTHERVDEKTYLETKLLVLDTVVFNKYAIIDLADVLTGLQYFAVTQQAAPKELLKKAAQVIDMIAKSLGYEEEKNGTEA